MFDDFLDKAARLRSRGESFAIATVVRYEAPISGKPGDKAIIDSGGKIWGWIGGGCAQPAVIKEALKAIADAKPRLVRISPSPNPAAPDGVLEYAMTCHSGGAVDIFIEPVLPKPQILILGRSVVAQALAKLGAAAGYAVAVLAADASRENFPEPTVLRGFIRSPPDPDHAADVRSGLDSGRRRRRSTRGGAGNRSTVHRVCGEQDESGEDLR